LIIASKLFQMVGPQTEKARWPSCVRCAERWQLEMLSSAGNVDQ